MRDLGAGYGIGKENGVRDRDDRSTGCGIAVKKSGNARSGTPFQTLTSKRRRPLLQRGRNLDFYIYPKDLCEIVAVLV